MVDAGFDDAAVGLPLLSIAREADLSSSYYFLLRLKAFDDIHAQLCVLLELCLFYSPGLLFARTLVLLRIWQVWRPFEP